MSMLFKRIKDWATSITAFRTGDVIPVDGPSGTAKMSKDDLLRVNAEKAEELVSSVYGNRVDDSLFSPPGMYLNTDGIGVYNSSFGQSGLIPCRPGETLYFYTNSDPDYPNKFYRPVCLFDKDKKYYGGISGTSVEQRKLTIPANVYYISVPIYYDGGVAEKIVIAGYLPNEFVEYSSDFEVTHKLVGREKDPENILDPSEVQMGGYVGGGGNWVTNANFCESGFIPLSRGSILYKYYKPTGETNWDRPTFAYYDENKSFLRVFTPGSGDAGCNLVPMFKGAAYIRFPLFASDAGNDTCVGYEPFSRFVPFSKKISFVRNVDMLQSLGADENFPMSQKAVTDAIGAISSLDGVQWAGKKWYAYGTSITSIAQGKYVPYVEAFSSMIATNKGIPGGGLGDLGAYSRGQVLNAICNTTDGKLEADLITLETGPNDAAPEVPLGTIYDTTPDTLAGCLNIALRYLQTNTTAQVVVISSVAWAGDAPNAADKYYEWFMMIRDICFINKVKFITAATNMGYAKINASPAHRYTVDNIHQTELGGYIYAESIWAELKNVPIFRTTLPT